MRRVALLVLLVLLGGACGGEKPSRSRSAAQKSDFTKGTLFDTASDAVDASGPTSRKSGGSKASTRSTKPVNRHGAPAVGTWQYRATLTMRGKTQTGFEGYNVIDAGEEGDGFRVLGSWVEGNNVKRQLLRWDATGRTVQFEQEARDDSVSLPCNWIPDYLDLPLPLRVGAKWQARSACDEGKGVTKDRTLSVEVTATEQVDVGGTLVDTFVLKRTTSSTLHLAGAHSLRTDENYTDKYAPALAVLADSQGTELQFFDGVPKGVTTRSVHLAAPRPRTS